MFSGSRRKDQILPKNPPCNGRLRPEVREGKMKRLSGVSMSHELTLFCLSQHPGSSHSTCDKIMRVAAEKHASEYS